MMADELNPVSDLAKCNECGGVHNIAALAYEPKKVRNLYEVPTASKIEFSQAADKSLTLYHPPAGWSWVHIFLIPFVVFWVGFVGFWTYMSLKIAYLISLFSIPFWYVGLAMAKGVINGIYGWEQVKVNRQGIELTKGRGKRIRSRTLIPLADIQEIRLVYRTKDQIRTSESFSNLKIERTHARDSAVVPAIITQEEEHYFFDMANSKEQDWLLDLLRDIRLKLS